MKKYYHNIIIIKNKYVFQKIVDELVMKNIYHWNKKISNKQFHHKYVHFVIRIKMIHY